MIAIHALFCITVLAFTVMCQQIPASEASRSQLLLLNALLNGSLIYGTFFFLSRFSRVQIKISNARPMCATVLFLAVAMLLCSLTKAYDHDRTLTAATLAWIAAQVCALISVYVHADRIAARRVATTGSAPAVGMYATVKEEVAV